MSQAQEEGIPYYFRDLRGDVLFAKDANGDERYAYDDGQTLVIPEDADGKFQFAKSTDGDELYPFDGEGNETVTSDRYARDRYGCFRYPRNALGDEYIGPLGVILLDDGRPLYLKNHLGEAAYPIDEVTGDEVYLQVDGTYVVLCDEWKGQRYARRVNGDEYYPPDGMTVAVARDGVTPLYAVTARGTVLHDGKYLKTRYGCQVYPRRKGDQRETVIGDAYAYDEEEKIFYYPLDAFGNEYVHRETLIEPYYPITNDGYAIVPKSSGEPLIREGMKPSVRKKDIDRELVREEGDDYVTKVRSSRIPRGEKKPYKTRACKKFIDDDDGSFQGASPAGSWWSSVWKGRGKNIWIGIVVLLLTIVCVAYKMWTFARNKRVYEIQ